MTKEEIAEVLHRVSRWPVERQHDAALALLEMETQDASSYQLDDEQVAEIRRRRAMPEPNLVSLTDLRQRLATRNG